MSSSLAIINQQAKQSDDVTQVTQYGNGMTFPFSKLHRVPYSPTRAMDQPLCST